VLRYDADKRILWIEADDYDQAWDAYRANPIAVPEIRAVVIQAEIAHLLRGSAMDTFFLEKRSALMDILEETRPKDFVHLLPFSKSTGKYQFLLTSPLKMWSFEIEAGMTSDHSAVQRSEELIEREIRDDETLVAVIRKEDGKDTHYFYLLMINEEFHTEVSTVWIERKKFPDWKWDKDTNTMLLNGDVIDFTGKDNPYNRLVNSLVS